IRPPSRRPRLVRSATHPCHPIGRTTLPCCRYCAPHTMVWRMNEAVDTHLQELRRGTVVLACLQLLREPGYGYALLERLDSHGLPTDANTLYPLLRRLEKQGFLTSEWNTEESRPWE